MKDYSDREMVDREMVDRELLDENLSLRDKVLHIATQLDDIACAESFAYWSGDVAAEVIREYISESQNGP